MTTAYVVADGGSAAALVQQDLESVGIAVLGTSGLRAMVEDVVRCAPDLVVVYESHPGQALFDGVASLRAVSPRPVMVFTTDPDADKIERAAAAGIQAYVVNGYAQHRLRSLIHVAQARFRHDRLLREELSDVQHRFTERKLVDRAKGILMRVRNIGEDEAYRVLRTAAMQAKLRIGQIAQQVIDASRYAEAVNRSGQLRMLSQRLVKLYALMCADVSPDATAALCRDSIEQIEVNFAILGRTLSKPTFGDLLDAVLTPWSALKRALAAAPSISSLPEIDRLAEKLLAQAEALTRTLEVAGFAAALRVINVSGRQRMLSQRLAKHAAVAALLGTETREAERAALRASSRAFADGLAYLDAVPLSTAEIRALLAEAAAAWAIFERAIEQADTAGGLERVAAGSETLLYLFDRLTDLYERSMQILME